MDVIRFDSIIDMQSGATLDEKLIALTKYGKPRISVVDGWSACIDMSVSANGVDFSIRSDFGCRTPSAAVDQLISRLKSTLGSLK